MKNIITGIILLMSLNLFSQHKKLIDYFFSETFNKKEYKWNIGIIEHELTQKDNDLIVSSSMKKLPNGMKMTQVNYFHPFDNKIVHTVQKTNLTNRFNRVDEVIIKYSKSKWSVSTNNYSSYFTTIKTNYKNYEDCIAVKIESEDFGSNTITKYYAYGIGLVKEQAYTSKGVLVYEKELIDNTETPTEEEISIKNEVKELRKKTYDYEEYQPEQYKMFVDRYTDRVTSQLKGASKRLLKTRKSYWKYDFKPTENIQEKAKVTFKKEYNRVYSDVCPSLKNIQNRDYYRLLKQCIDDDEFPMVCFDFEGEPDCYDVSTVIKINDFKIDISKGITVVRINSKGVKFLEKGLANDIKNKVSDLMPKDKKGKYLLSYFVGSVNREDISEIAFEKM